MPVYNVSLERRLYSSNVRSAAVVKIWLNYKDITLVSFFKSMILLFDLITSN